MGPDTKEPTSTNGPALPSFSARQYHHLGLQFLIAAMVKAKAAQNQLWDDTQPQGRVNRWMDSLSAVLMAWLSIEGIVNDAVLAILDKKKVAARRAKSSLYEKLESCVVAKLDPGAWDARKDFRDGFNKARNFRNRLIHYSAAENPSEPRWDGQELPHGMGVAWFVGAPPSQYKEGLVDQIDPERAWQFCGVALDVARLVYLDLGVAPAVQPVLSATPIDSKLLPHEPSLADLMAGIPISQVERYVRALRVAEQYPDEWWVLDPNGRRRPYRAGDDLKPETILTAFEGEPTEESLGEYWQEYWDALSPMAVRTKVIRRSPSGDWCLELPPPRPLFSMEPDDDPE
jgi:hypothetical protein